MTEKTPIEKMCEAWWDADLGANNGRAWASATETVKANHRKRMRAALRALATVEPTEKMQQAAYAYRSGYGEAYIEDEAKAYILAAADEGENDIPRRKAIRR